MEYLKQNKRKILAGAVLFAVAIGLIINRQLKTVGTKTSPTTNSEPTITLSISGEVKNPGVYTFKKGSSLMDNISLFGGFTEDADLLKTNPEEKLYKDAKITVKVKPKNDNVDYEKLYQPPK